MSVTKFNTVLRLTGRQHALLKAHLFPGDGKEAVAVLVCGRRREAERHAFSVRQIVTIPYEECHRTEHRVVWPTERLQALLPDAARRGHAIFKIHSHPPGFETFSPYDDAADRDLFASLYGWVETEEPHGSAVMRPDGGIFARTVSADGEFTPVDTVAVAGDNIHFWHHEDEATQGADEELPEFTRRHAQAFGAGTTAILRRLSVAVIGCSGTGSPLIEQLARLGVGRLVLIDPDKLEEKNLNRIYNATMRDVEEGQYKVDVLARAIRTIGIGTDVVPLACNLFDPKVVRAVADCDLVFGCMDGVDGRHLLNKLAAFYLLPYFDVGVKLVSDGHGGVDQICGTVHSLQPDGSSLLSRHVYTMEQVRAADLRRTDPEQYAEQLRSKYIIGVQEDRPAVISVNSLLSSMAVNELLARLHPYRDDGNENFAVNRISLTQSQAYFEPEGEPCRVLSRHAGRGDVTPLLDMPSLSDINGGTP